MREFDEVMFLWTETPLHAGSGDSLGVVDLPIQRERHTNHPIVNASTLKGAVRDHCRRIRKKTDNGSDKVLDAVFGPENAEHASAVAFSDANVLLFPVRSLQGVCAWVTCSMAVYRLKRDLERCGKRYPLPDWDHTSKPSEGEVWAADIPGKNPLLVNNSKGDVVLLEEYCLQASTNKIVTTFADWVMNSIPDTKAYDFLKDKLASCILILSDEDYTHFVESSTDIVQRNKVDIDTGTVNNTALWTEENLPSDTLLYSLLHISKPKSGDKTPEVVKDAKGVKSYFAETITQMPYIQIGGNETIGRGITYAKLLTEGKPDARQ